MSDKIMLTPEEQSKLEGVDAEVRRLRQELERAKTAGIDVSDLEAGLEEAERLRKGILKVYASAARRLGPGAG